MNRETKISLLVALGFVLVVGILLSEHVTSVNEPASAALSRAGDDIRRAIETPLDAPPIVTRSGNTRTTPTASQTLSSQFAPSQFAPSQVATSGAATSGAARSTIIIRQDLSQPQQPQAREVNAAGASQNLPAGSASVRIDQPNLPVIADLPEQSPSPQNAINDVLAAQESTPENGNNLANTFATPGQIELQNLAREMGEEVVGIGQQNTNDTASEKTTLQTEEPAAIPTVKSVRNYIALPGDSLSKLAGRFLGGNTPANRSAIINLNPSLQKDPDHVVVGRTYLIPTDAWAAAMQLPLPTHLPTYLPATSPTAAAKPPLKTSTYIVVQGDTLWKIAKDQLGSTTPAVIDELKKRNANVLGDGDTVKVGMKLNLPPKP